MAHRICFDGVEYACIGFVRRKDWEGYSWQEYLLFNPFAGFRWLVTYDGHWSWVEVLQEEAYVRGLRAADAVFQQLQTTA